MNLNDEQICYGLFFDKLDLLEVLQTLQFTYLGFFFKNQDGGAAISGKDKDHTNQVRIISIITRFNNNTDFFCFMQLGFVTG